jgi:hypothetical protein
LIAQNKGTDSHGTQRDEDACHERNETQPGSAGLRTAFSEAGWSAGRGLHMATAFPAELAIVRIPGTT